MPLVYTVMSWFEIIYPDFDMIITWGYNPSWWEWLNITPTILIKC